MELNKKLNQKCKAQIIEYLNQTSKIRNAINTSFFKEFI